MRCARRWLAPVTTALVALLAAPDSASAQATITATATVVGRPLMLRAVQIATAPGTLWVSLDGCGTGALTVDASQSQARAVRVFRQSLPASPGCERRSFLVTLPSGPVGADASWEVALVQDDGLLAPSVAQVVISADAMRLAGRSSRLR